MTAVREAILLPACFLTVVLAAAIRPGAAPSMEPPSLASLLAATALFALLLRSHAVVPGELVNSNRSLLANLSGGSVLLTAFVASAELTTAVVPESGVPALMTWAVLVSLMAQALVMAPERTPLLRGLMVTFGAAFALKFIVLAALSAPAEGRLARALQLLFEGVTLGTVTQRSPHPAEGYLAFGAIALYLIGVAALRSGSRGPVVARELVGATTPFVTRVHRRQRDSHGDEETVDAE
jgi:hypothetical protein